MGDLKSKLPDLKELTSMSSKLFNGIKGAVTEIIHDYKEKRAEQEAKENAEEALKAKETPVAVEPVVTKETPVVVKSTETIVTPVEPVAPITSVEPMAPVTPVEPLEEEKKPFDSLSGEIIDDKNETK
jgi:hypothetical protein